MLQEEAVSNYRGHVGYLLCVDWSPVDPDLIWTGGKDFTLQEWRVSKQEFTKPPKGEHLSLQHCPHHSSIASRLRRSHASPLREKDGGSEGEDEGQFQTEEEE